MEANIKEIHPRPLTKREERWIREILQTSDEWKGADISKTQVVAEGPCDEGLSFLLHAPQPQHPNPGSAAGYIGRIVIWNNDNTFIEVRLDQVDGKLRELFVLFVDPKHPQRGLPDSWVEVSHEATSM